MRQLLVIALLVAATCRFGFAEETSFSSVRLPTPKGKLVKSVLTFSDKDKAVEIRPQKNKANPVNIPFADIDKFSYEFTEDLATGFKKIHWLQIDYHDQGISKTMIVRMRKRDYIHILDAVKAHTGHDAEVLGNTVKSGRPQ